jgi:putative endopeptidase
MNKELIKKNFYNAVNEKWLETAVIPDDQPSMSAFLELHLDIEKLLMDLTKKWVLDPSGLNKNLKNFIKYYKI